MKTPKIVQMAIDRDGLVKAVLYDDGKIFILNYVLASVSTTGNLGNTWQWQELMIPEPPTPAPKGQRRGK
jgi:hypothetical protein